MAKVQSLVAELASLAPLISQVEVQAQRLGLTVGVAAPRLAELHRKSAGGSPVDASPAARVVAVAEPGDRDGSPQGSDGTTVLGDTYSEGLDTEIRRQFGSFYTPPGVARGLVDLALDGYRPRQASDSGVGAEIPSLRVLDPSCGAGAFLLAAAKELVAIGHHPKAVLASLYGIDIDPLALALCEVTLRLWAADRGVVLTPDAGPILLESDYLIDHPRTASADPTRSDTGAATNGDRPGWFDLGPEQLGHFDLVVGNPPFLNQLESTTARSASQVAALKQRFGRAGSGYGDTSALFILAGLDDLRDGGRLVLVQPDSVVSAAGAAAVRSDALERAGLLAMWDANARIFDASVYVCAPVMERGRHTGLVRRFRGVDFADQEPADWTTAAPATWAELLAGGAPKVDLGSRDGTDAPTLATVASATAGFRDQFYGLAPHAVDGSTRSLAQFIVSSDSVSSPRTDSADGSADPSVDDLKLKGQVPLITSGLIEPLECRWGQTTARFAGEVWSAPMVDMASLSGDPKLHRWVADRLAPKVLLATQTKVIECFPDPDGLLVPSVPVIAVECSVDDVYRIAAALSAPPVSAWAMNRAAGAALSKGALKLSASQVLEVPLPTDAARWAEGAELVHRLAHIDIDAEALDLEQRHERLGEIGRVMTAAYGIEDGHPVFEWWQSRLVNRRRSR